MVFATFAKATVVDAGCGAVGPVPLAERGSSKNLKIKDFRFFGTSAFAYRNMVFVYIIEATDSKRYYIGQTENLEERIKKHNAGRNLSTKAYVPWKLKWWKEYETRSEAIKVEKKLKRIKKRIRIEKFITENGFSGCSPEGAR
jgi:putative endonuclease